MDEEHKPIQAITYKRFTTRQHWIRNPQKNRQRSHFCVKYAPTRMGNPSRVFKGISAKFI